MAAEDMAANDDARILDELVQALKWDQRIDKSGIDVIVSEGEVTLRGSVATAAEREAAIEDAYDVRGVKAVTANLEVLHSAPDSDDAIAADLRATLQGDLRVDDSLIVVEVAGAIVRLTGTVSTEEARRVAEEDSLGTSGVTRVVNSISVVPFASREDAKIEAEVLAELARETRIEDANHIGVTSLGRHVYLRGSVGSIAERHVAEEAARRTQGVVQVYNQIVVATVPHEPRPIRRPRI